MASDDYTERQARAWNRQFDRLVEFHRAHGHFKIPNQGDYVDLHIWLSKQCLQKKQHQLRPERQQRLEALGLDWDLYRRNEEQRWNRQFDRLVEFHRTHGHFNIRACGESKVLYDWLVAQCLLKRFHRLRPDRQQQLEQLDFDWDWRQRKWERIWDKHFNQLVAFHQTHGHFEVPEKSPTNGLHLWVREQRQLQRSGQLPGGCRQRLEAVGFPWIKPGDLQEQAWNRRFAQLMEYHQTQGDFRVPEKVAGNTGLMAWISMQRILHRLHRLRPDRLQQLEAAGFVWITPLQRKLDEKRLQAVREPLPN